MPSQSTGTGDLSCPPEPRRAARAERQTLRTLSLERDNPEGTPWRRAEALEAERRRESLLLWDP